MFSGDGAKVFFLLNFWLRLKSQPVRIHSPQIKDVSWPGQSWVVCVSLGSDSGGGSLPHREQQLANRIYGCTRAPAVQMHRTTQRKQI